ncbi:MAG: hypothetical protein FD169_1998 [Bacillota bacterium]|nr:MAG: hypothetical protein FD169_1998 [Bacillota bacterium]
MLNISEELELYFELKRSGTRKRFPRMRRVRKLSVIPPREAVGTHIACR